MGNGGQLMGLPMQKPEETFSILVKLVITKKLYLRRAYFFDLKYTINAKSVFPILARALNRCIL